MKKNVIHRNSTHIKGIIKYQSKHQGETVILHKRNYEGWVMFCPSDGEKYNVFTSMLREPEAFEIIDQWHQDVPMRY